MQGFLDKGDNIMNLSSEKESIYSYEISSLKKGLILFAMIFSTSLYIRLQHAIGQKSSKESRCFLLRMRARKVEFKDPKTLP
jgi:hypothetical protein